MIDLIITYDTTEKKDITLKYNTIMDFTESLELIDIDVTYTDASNITAMFFENPRIQINFNSFKELYEHCICIMK